MGREMMTDETHTETTAATMARFGIARISRGDAIKAKCLDCAGSRNEVRLCEVASCALWPFRLGEDPWRAPVSEERRAALAAAAIERFGLNASNGQAKSPQDGADA